MEGGIYRGGHNQKVGLELIHDDGKPITSCPIDMNELVKKMGKTVKVQEGVRVRLEEYNEDDGLYYSEESTSEESEESSESDESCSDEVIADTPPPGSRMVEDYHTAVRAAQRGERLSLSPAPGRPSESPQPAQGNGTAGAEEHVSRRELWVSRAPPMDSERTYKRLRTVPLLPCPTSRRFCPPPLMFHAAACYSGSAARGPRMLVYGGTTNLGRTTENELYEFSLLSGDWRRVEGKQSHSPGVYGHTAVVLRKLRRVILTGGVGFGGVPPEPLESMTDGYRRARFHLLFPHKEAVRANPQTSPESVTYGEQPTLWTLAHAAAAAPTFGFLPVVFDMNLTTRRWRTVETKPQLPVAFHSAVSCGSRVYIFGGVNTYLQVSSQLILFDGETRDVSLIPPSTESPKARFLHSAVVYAHWMIIYGGFDTHNQPLDDAWAFDTVNERWEQMDCHGSPSRGGHAACVVGSRLIIIGGFDSSFDSGEAPTNTCFELNLVPDHANKHIWRPVPLYPTVAPLAFAAVCPCGDDASFLLYGGCVMAKKGNASKNVQIGSGLSPSRGNHKTGGDAGHDHEGGGDEDNLAIWRRLTPCNEGVLFTFPVKAPEKNTDGDDEPRYNELGIEIDPDEVPAEFMAFVKRQQDFLLKKRGNTAQAMKKISLEEQEGMEPHLYLKPDEIERLVEESEELCARFSEYKMDDLPAYIPERQLRLHLNEECISLSRQVRDVIRSMKGNPAAAAAVKSKTHRYKVGQKFESHSAPKPFRRVIVMSLMKEIRKNIKRVCASNKALRTVEWPDKAEYLEVIQRMQETANGFLLSVKEILDVYIEKRVDSLMTAINTRKNRLKRLTEAVERSRRNFPVHPLDIVARMRGRGRRSSPPQYPPCSPPRCRSPAAKRSKDGEEVVHPLNRGEAGAFLRKASVVRENAVSFSESCRVMIAPPSGPSTTSASLPGQPLAVPSALAIPTQSPACPSSGEDPGLHRNTVWHVAQGQAEEIVECIDRFAENIRASQPEQSPTKEDGEESNPNEGACSVKLALSTFWPLVTCKENFDELKRGIPDSHRSSPGSADDEGASKLEGARKQYSRLSKCLSGLVQSVKMSMLSKAGAKSAVTPPSLLRDASLACSSSRRRVRKSPQPRRRRATIEVMDVCTGSVAEPEEYACSIPEEPQHHHAVLSALSPKLVPIEDLFSPRAATAPEEPKQIPITSTEAAALVSPYQSSVTAAGECVIIPSKKDVKVVKNSLSSSLFFHPADDSSTATPARLFSPQAFHDYYAAWPTSTSTTGATRVAVSHGPKVVSAGENRGSDAVISVMDVFDGVHPPTAPEEGKTELKAMVSVNPGFFHAQPSTCAMETSTTSDHIKYCDSPMLEDDYFFFGRRFLTGCMPPAPAKTPTTPVTRTVTKDPSCKKQSTAKRGGEGSGRMVKSPSHRSSRSPTTTNIGVHCSVSRGERAVRQLGATNLPASGGSGRHGKMTPGEARTAEAKKRQKFTPEA